MNLFISWSGEKSRKIADIFCDLLPQIINYITPWYSPQSIEAGSIWDSAINKALQTDFGLVILTEENKEKPWILFESGALSKGLDNSRLFTFLVDLAPNDLLHNPLTKFNHTVNNRESIFKLINTINNNLGDIKLNESTLDKVFLRIYPEIETRIDEVLKSIKTVATKPPSTAEVLNEVLDNVRDLNRRFLKLELRTRNSSMQSREVLSKSSREIEATKAMKTWNEFVENLLEKTEWSNPLLTEKLRDIVFNNGKDIIDP